MGNKLIVDQYLNIFLFDTLYKCPQEQRRMLSKKFLLATKSSRTAQAFIRKSSLEEKLELLTQLDIKWFMVFFDRGHPQKKYVGEIFKDFKNIEKEERKDVISRLIEKRIFVTDDKEFAHRLGLMTKINNHNSYSQSALLTRATYHIQKWDKILKEKETKKSIEDTESIRYLFRTILSAMDVFGYVESLLGILQNDLQILLYLYLNRRDYVQYDILAEEFRGHITKRQITNSIRRLYKNQMVQKTAKTNTRDYTITATGILNVNTFLDTVLKTNTF